MPLSMRVMSLSIELGTAASDVTFAIFREQRSSACSTMIMVPPGPGKTDHLMPGSSAWARVHRDMSCLVVMCEILVIPVITVSPLGGARVSTPWPWGLVVRSDSPWVGVTRTAGGTVRYRRWLDLAGADRAEER